MDFDLDYSSEAYGTIDKTELFRRRGQGVVAAVGCRRVGQQYLGFLKPEARDDSQYVKFVWRDSANTEEAPCYGVEGRRTRGNFEGHKQGRIASANSLSSRTIGFDNHP